MIKNDKMHSIICRLNNISDPYKKPLPDKPLDMIKKICQLPNDFILLNKICRCDYFRLFDFYNFENKEGVIEETQYYREYYFLMMYPLYY